MEDDQKKSGARGDISDLKARLGLKKGGGGAAPTIPAPPGFASAAEGDEGAAEGGSDEDYDPRRDPFKSTGPVAPPAYYGYQPIPGVDDGKPAEQLNKPQPLGRIIILAVAALALVASSFTLGKIQWARANMNHTIDQAADIRVEVERMSKKLNAINERVASSTEAAKNNADIQLAADLGSLDLKKPDTDKIFKTNYYYMDDLSVDLLFNYYNDTIALYNLVAVHARKTEADKESIENFVKAGKAGDKNYGVTIDMSGAIPLAHLAEMGSPVCPKEGDVNCTATELKGFKFRTEAGGQWFQKPVKGPPATIIIPLQKTPLSTGAMAGSPDILAVKDHVRRQIDIRNLTAKLFGEQKELLSKLELAAEKKRKVNEYLIF